MMAKVNLDITADDFEAASKSGDFVQPQPGIYTAKLIEVNAGFSKTDGKEDKKKPRLECIYEIIGEGRDGAESDINYSRLYDYITFGEAAGWKRAQFALAMELADGKKAFKKKVDTDELIGKKVVTRVKADKDLEGNYRGRLAAVFPFKDADEDAAFAATNDDEDADTDSEDEESPF